MKLPIFAYGHSILRQPAKAIDERFPGLEKLIENMWDTMKGAKGCGLAAPQIGQSIRLFIVDSKSTYDHHDESDRSAYFEKGDQGVMETFINPKIIECSDKVWADTEGCLSIPGITREITRPWTIAIAYYDTNFEKHIRNFSGLTARMIQHEYDHTEGILYIDHLQPLTRKLLDGRLKKIAKGQVPVRYSMKFK